MSTYCVVASGVAFLAALVSMPLMIRLAVRYKIVDTPRHRKIHKESVPYLGGVGILTALLAAAGVLAIFFPFSVQGVEKAVTILGATTLSTMIGLLDDRYHVSARSKLVLQFIATAVFVFFGYRWQVVTIPGMQSLDLHYLAAPFTMFWIVTLVNAINLCDGVDGLAGSISSSILIVIAVTAGILGDHAVMLLALAGAGASIGYLFFNWRPAQIYMGDAGSYGLGMLIATLLVTMRQGSTSGVLADAYIPERFLYQVPIASMICAYPLIELFLTVSRRFVRGKSIGSADRGHIHHRLLGQGWNAPQICAAAIFVSLMAGAIVIAAVSKYNGVAAWLLAISGVLFGVSLNFCGYLNALMPATIRESRPHFLIANHFVAMQKIKLELAQSVGEVIALMNQTSTEFDIAEYQLSVEDVEAAGEPLTYAWATHAEARQHLGFAATVTGDKPPVHSDRITLDEARSFAEWKFLSHSNEEDIDVEYRVLMSEFMEAAMRKIQSLYCAEEAIKVSALSESSAHLAIRSSTLKNRAVRKKAVAAIL